MVKFICNEQDCPNAGIEYFFVNGYDTAECGGCKTMLEPQETIMKEPEIG